MAKPYIHAESSARRFGGKPDDYIEIHNFLDSSKAAFADNRHRALTHNAWFIGHVLERIKFSNSEPPNSEHKFLNIINSDGKRVSVRDVGEQHILEDFRGKFIPSAQDYLQEMEFIDWMQNGAGENPKGAVPPSFKKIAEKDKRKIQDALQPRHSPADMVVDGSRDLPWLPRKDVVFDGSNVSVPGHLKD